MCSEAFAAWIPPLGVPFSYGVAISYVLVDTLDKGVAAYREAQAELGGSAASATVNIGGWVAAWLTHGTAACYHTLQLATHMQQIQALQWS